MYVFLDFNQVLKKSSAQSEFISVDKLVDISKTKNSSLFSQLNSIFLNQKMIEWATEKQGIAKFYLWSASNPALLQLIKELFSPLFTAVISTRETGLHKSEVASYDAIIKMFDIKLEESLLIDDQIENVNAAVAAGWQAIHFTSTANCLQQFDTLTKENQ